MRLIQISTIGFLVIFMTACGMFENELLEESESPKADVVALDFIESYVNRDFAHFRELMQDDDELRSYAQYGVEKQHSEGQPIYNGMEFEEVIETMEEENYVTDYFSESDLEVIANYSDDTASYVATHGMRESREADYFQIDEKGIFDSTFRDMYGSDESFIIFSFEVTESGDIINLNENYETFIEDMANKEQTYVLKGEVEPSNGG